MMIRSETLYSNSAKEKKVIQDEFATVLINQIDYNLDKDNIYTKMPGFFLWYKHYLKHNWLTDPWYLILMCITYPFMEQIS